MTTERRAQAALIFMLSPENPQTQWQAFVRYFHDHNYACYACAVGVGSLSEPAPTPWYEHTRIAIDSAVRVVIACGRDSEPALTMTTSPESPGSPDALALLFPPASSSWRLAFRPPAVPTWLAYPAQQPAQRFAASMANHMITTHQFRGISPRLLDQPGWERVAFALRVWIESTLSEMVH